MFSKVVAILYALACPTCEPELQAVYVTDAGSSICQSTADSLNAERTLPTDPRFYCDE